jgi:hypothetical protein
MQQPALEADKVRQEHADILELHLTPERLTEEIAGFTQGCFREKRASGSRRRTPVAARRSAPRRG